MLVGIVLKTDQFSNVGRQRLDSRPNTWLFKRDGKRFPFFPQYLPTDAERHTTNSIKGVKALLQRLGLVGQTKYLARYFAELSKTLTIFQSDFNHSFKGS